MLIEPTPFLTICYKVMLIIRAFEKSTRRHVEKSSYRSSLPVFLFSTMICILFIGVSDLAAQPDNEKVKSRSSHFYFMSGGIIDKGDIDKQGPLWEMGFQKEWGWFHTKIEGFYGATGLDKPCPCPPNEDCPPQPQPVPPCKVLDGKALGGALGIGAGFNVLGLNPQISLGIGAIHVGKGSENVARGNSYAIDSYTNPILLLDAAIGYPINPRISLQAQVSYVQSLSQQQQKYFHSDVLDSLERRVGRSGTMQLMGGIRYKMGKTP